MVTMEPEDSREWEVTINRRKCPAIYYPANIVGNKCSFDKCPLKVEEPPNESCPVCDKPLHGSSKTLTSMEDERVVHLARYISEPCDCPHEFDGCHFSGFCKHKRLNGTWLPACGLKFSDKKDGGNK